jgi:PAS domain S-box-containing protein
MRVAAASRSVCCALALCAVLAAMAAEPPAAQSIPGKNVLVLNSFSDRSFDSLDPLKRTIRSRIKVPVTFYVEYLDPERLNDAAYRKGLGQAISRAYAEKHIDLIVAAAYPALSFAVENRHGISPGIPIVFVGVSPIRFPSGVPWPGVTGVTTNVDVPGSLDLALRLQPDTGNVAVIAGQSEIEQFWMEAVGNEVRHRRGNMKFIEISGRPSEALIDQALRLPAHTIVFVNILPQAAYQPDIGIYELVSAIAQHFPTYCLLNSYLDHGAVGGSYSDENISGIKGGEIAARVLLGEKPENIPVEHNSQVHATVDWRQLKRWRMSESALPPGTVVLFRQRSVWDRYSNFIVAGIFLSIFQALLIIGLLWERARKRRMQASVRESESRFRLMADTTPSLIWMCDEQGDVTYLNQRRVDFTGRDPDAGFGDTWTAYVHPEDADKVQSANARGLERQEGYSKEYRLRRRDGIYRWLFDVASPRFDAEGSFIGFIGSAIDVTEQRMAREALEKIGGRLIEAQEKERSRIARELHDDICQRLALLSVEISQARRFADEPADAREARLLEIGRHSSEIAGDVQALSHELHSSKLDYLGIEAALRGLCKEFSQQQGVEVSFLHDNVPGPLSRGVSLCIFRVAQEALHNAAKHSGVKEIHVELRGVAGRIEVEVSDAGVGFDMRARNGNSGLGLVSMRERVHLMHGSFSVESKKNRGTKIVVSLPLEPQMETPSREQG